MHTENYKGHLAMFTVNVIFGLNNPISKMVMEDGNVSAISLSLMRFIGAAALFWLVSLFTKREKVAPKDLLLIFFASLFAIQLNQMLFIKGLSMTSPVDASIMATLTPIITMLLAALFLREPITWKKTGGVILGLLGALLVITGGRFKITGNMAGNLLCLGSSLAFAFYLTLFKRIIIRYSPVTLMKWMFLFALVCTMPIFWKDLAAVNVRIMSNDIIMGIAYVLLLATFTSYLLIPIGQKNLRPTIVSMYNYLQPLVAALVAVMVFQDTFRWTNGAAALLIFLGVWLTTRSKSRAQVEAERSLRS